MRNLLLYGIAGMLLLAGCNKEEELVSTTGELKNWFEIKDKPGEFNQLAYKVYRETGMPVLVNDTLGVEERGVDFAGNPVIHVELLKIGYGVFTQKYDADFVLSKDTAAMVRALEVLDERVLPNLPVKYRPNSYLLVDTLYDANYGWSNTGKWHPAWRPGYAYKSAMGTVVGQLSDILKDGFDESFWAGMVVSAAVWEKIKEDSAEELTVFYTYAKNDIDTTEKLKAFYDESFYENLLKPENTSKFYNRDCREMSFLSWRLDGPHTTTLNLRKTLTKDLDIVYYIAAVYAYTEDEFKSKFNTVKYPKCWEKYKIMKELVGKFKEKEFSI